MSVIMYVPKYSLKAGYVAVSGTVEGKHFRPDGRRFDWFKVGRDIFEDIFSALDAAEILRQKRLASLHGSIKRVEAMGPFPRLPQHVEDGK